MRKYLFLFFIFPLAVKAQNIDGLWQSTKPGAELFIEIKGSKAVITSVGKTSLTKKLENGYMYEEITLAGQNKWSARRNAWKYNGVGGVNADSGRWEKAENLTLILSTDGKTLSASGHWTYKRVNSKIVVPTGQSTEAAKTEITENFGGLEAKLSLVNKKTGGNFILSQFKNTTKNKEAHIKVTLANGSVFSEVLYPANTLTKKYDTGSVEIEVKYIPVNAVDEEQSLIDAAKQAVRKRITIENNNIIVSPIGSPGVRG